MYATPSAQEPLRVEAERHRAEIASTAHIIHLRRHLMAEGDPYQQQMIAQTSPDILAQRDWLLAESIINQQNPDAIAALQHSYSELYERKYGVSPEVVVYPTPQVELVRTA